MAGNVNFVAVVGPAPGDRDPVAGDRDRGPPSSSDRPPDWTQRPILTFSCAVELPPGSRTVSVTVKVPRLANLWLTWRPLPVLWSPKVQAYVVLPLTLLALASNTTDLWTRGCLVLTENFAFGRGVVTPPGCLRLAAGVCWSPAE